ncbi:MAG: hypothetical protein WBQ95_15880 [Terracidiphilus sp.]
MRRFLASMMLSLIGSFQVAPLLAFSFSNPEANLPACCRRNGPHHCAMTGNAERSLGSGSKAHTIYERCPFYPRAAAVPAFPFHAAPSPSRSNFAQIASHPANHPQIDALYRLSLDRSRQKRGPPGILL